MKTLIHVAVGVVTDKCGQILIAKRPQQAHQGGLWEFPGGKVEDGESVQQALTRELREELGIECLASRPLIDIVHDYGDKQVKLDVHRVTAFSGEPQGMEGQPVRWVAAATLPNYPFPAANRPIIQALMLPDRLLITGAADGEGHWFSRLERALHLGVRLVRARHVPPGYIARAHSVCHSLGARLVVDGQWTDSVAADGYHYTSAQLLALKERPSHSVLVGASCHTAREIAAANRLGLDYICLSPVQPTSTHPHAEVLGWEEFARLVSGAAVPVYALGGMTEADVALAQQHGAQGVAGISAWW